MHVVVFIMHIFCILQYKLKLRKGCAGSVYMPYFFYIFNIAQKGHESNEKCIKLTKKLYNRHTFCLLCGGYFHFYKKVEKTLKLVLYYIYAIGSKNRHQ